MDISERLAKHRVEMEYHRAEIARLEKERGDLPDGLPGSEPGQPDLEARLNSPECVGMHVITGGGRRVLTEYRSSNSWGRHWCAPYLGGGGRWLTRDEIEIIDPQPEADE